MSTTARKARKRTHILAAEQLRRDPQSKEWARIERESRFSKPAKVATPLLGRAGFWGRPLKRQLSDLVGRGLVISTEQMKTLVDVDADRRRIARRMRRRSS
jgi:hypothetical protein